MKIYWMMTIALGLSNSVFASDNPNPEKNSNSFCAKIIETAKKKAKQKCINAISKLPTDCEGVLKSYNEGYKEILKASIPENPEGIPTFATAAVVGYAIGKAAEHFCSQNNNNK